MVLTYMYFFVMIAIMTCKSYEGIMYRRWTQSKIWSLLYLLTFNNWNFLFFYLNKRFNIYKIQDNTHCVRLYRLQKWKTRHGKMIQIAEFICHRQVAITMVTEHRGSNTYLPLKIIEFVFESSHVSQYTTYIIGTVVAVIVW